MSTAKSVHISTNSIPSLSSGPGAVAGLYEASQWLAPGNGTRGIAWATRRAILGGQMDSDTAQLVCCEQALPAGKQSSGHWSLHVCFTFACFTSGCSFFPPVAAVMTVCYSPVFHSPSLLNTSKIPTPSLSLKLEFYSKSVSFWASVSLLIKVLCDTK